MLIRSWSTWVSFTCRCRAYVVQQGLHVVPKGRTCHSWISTGSSHCMFQQREWRSGLSLASILTRWNMALISLEMATECWQKRSKRLIKKELKTGPGSRYSFRTRTVEHQTMIAMCSKRWWRMYQAGSWVWAISSGLGFFTYPALSNLSNSL